MTEPKNAPAAELYTKRLRLRPLRPSDAGPIELFCSDARVARMLELVPHPYPPGAAVAYIEGTLSGARAEHVFVMDATPIEGEELVGVISVKPRGPNIWRIGYWVGPPYWGTGFASEAASAVVAHLFEGGAVEIEARVNADNPASVHVLEKAGLVKVGEGEGFCLARGEVSPMLVYRATSADWRAG